MDRAHGALWPLLSVQRKVPSARGRDATDGAERKDFRTKSAAALHPRLGRNPPKPDLELEAGARAHFDDPLYYASTYEAREDDARYYLTLAMKRGRRHGVLEHGVGNGRIALPIAREGISVTGVDHSQPMLDHLAERLEQEDARTRRRVKLTLGDMRSTRTGGRFSLVICPFNAALHLYTREDVEQWLACVREQLAPGGELVFDISMPLPKDLARDPGTPYRVAPFVHPTAGRVGYREYFDYDRVRQILFVSMFFEPMGTKGARAARAPEFMTPLAHRQFHPCEMEALLHYNGFEVTALYGDYTEGPLVQASDVMVWHARPRIQTKKRASAR